MPADGAQPAVRPRDAATLVLVRRDGERARVLMGQRHAGHAFMPRKFVFPGGGVDPGDARVPVARELRPEVAAQLAVRCPPSRGRALALASIRETYEETGLLFGQRQEHLPRTRAAGWTEFFSHGVLPDLAPLELVARAVTPPDQPRRFDARFFMADAASIQGDADADLAGSGELLDLHWVRLEEARELDLARITRLVISELAGRVAAPPGAPAPPVPFYRYQRGQPIYEKL